MFALIHGRDGLIDTGQRDLVMTALLLGAAVFLVRAMRAKSRAVFAFTVAFGLCLGTAATVKPLALLLLPVWLAIFRQARRGRGPALPLSVAACYAALVAPCIMFLALLHWHALGAFASVMRYLVPLHADTFRLPLQTLAAGSISSVMLGLFAAWLPLAWMEKPWRKAESAVLLAGFAFGLLSFLAQGRGYPYHRYPSEAFFLLLAAQAFERGLTGSRASLVLLSSLGFAFGSLVIVPKSLAAIYRFTGTTDDYGAALQQELQSLGPAQSLDREVQCFDQAGGCITQLYNTRIVQGTGFLYDCYLFVTPRSASDAEEQGRYRAAFLRSFIAAAPKYLIVTSDECGLHPADFSYAKLQAWPVLAGFMADWYSPLTEWTPTRDVSWGGKPTLPYGFRIYKRTVGQ